MASEFDIQRQVCESVKDFVFNTGTLPRNNFIIKGAVRDISTSFSDFAAIFPEQPGREGLFAVVGLVPGKSGTTTLGQITKLDFPQRVRHLRMASNPSSRRVAESIASLNGWPIATLALGKTNDRQEEVVVLICLPGIDPEQAFNEIKERSRRKLSSLS